MKQRWRDWLAETHGTRFELMRHFLPRFFDSDLVASPGDWIRVAIGGIAMLASSWMLLAAVLLFKYNQLAAYPPLWPAEARADLATISAMCVCVTVLMAALLWQSLYPSLRDYLSLAAMPVSSADLFAAKFCAVGLAFAGLAALLTLPSAIVYSAIAGAPLIHSFLTMAAACTVAFFGLVSVQGIFLCLLPARWFERCMIWMQALLVAASLGGFSFAAWKGPELAGAATLPARGLLLAIVLPPFVTALTYLAGFHRYRRLLLEAPQVQAGRRFDLLSWSLDLCLGDPREQAAFGFIWTTIQRNRVHRLAVLVCLALTAAWMSKSAVDLLSRQATQSELDTVMSTLWPLGLILFAMLGMRYLFSLPAHLPSNWVFRVAEREGRRAWLDAVEKFVLVCSGVPVILGALMTARTDGPIVAVAWACIAFGLAGVSFEGLFRDWRKMPFTCSYLPAKRSPILNAILFFGLMPLLLPVAWTVHACASNPASFLIAVSLEAALWSHLRRSRQKDWGHVTLRYEEEPEPEVDPLQLGDDGRSFAQEQFHREWSVYLRGEPDPPIVRPLEDGETYAGRALEWIKAFPQDLQFAGRMLIRNAGFALTLVLTLGLGLGLNAAFFSVFNAFLLEPLAVRDPASLVSVEFATRYHTPIHLSWEGYRQFATNVRTMSVAASTVDGVGLEGKAAKAGIVGANYFSLLGVGTALGRPFEHDERESVMVLSHRTWQSRFGGDPRILGRRLQVNGIPFAVIGVARPEFAGVAVGTIAIAPPELARYGVGAADFWMPMEVWNRLPNVDKVGVLGIIGRLNSGVGAEGAMAEITGVARRLTQNGPDYSRIHTASLETLDIPITWTALRYSLPLLMAFALSMLIPCANAANMMLARAMVRQRELGVRLALGAGRGRVVRQLLTESLPLALLAAGVGLVLARLALHLLTQLIHATAPPTLLFKMRIPDFPIGVHVFVYMLIVSGLTTVVFALAPAAQATRSAVSFALRGEFKGFRASHLRDGLVVGQVACCVMLVAIAGVLLRGTGRARGVDRGYDVEGVYAVANQSPEDAHALARMLEGEPWIESMAYFGRPLNEMDTLQVNSVSRPAWSGVYYHYSSTDFFRMARIPILRGRTFTRGESESVAPVAVVSQRAAAQLWPGEDPIGKSFSIQEGQPESYRLPRFRQATVIGVSRDIVSKVRDGGPRPSIHFPAGAQRGTLIAVRGRGAPDDTRRRLETALAHAPGALHGARVVGAQEPLDWETYPQRAASWLSTLLGGVALLLTMTGMYGVLAYLVSQRTREIGIRLALGATAGQVAHFILAYSTRLAAAGIVFGWVLAFGALRYAASLVNLAIDQYDLPAYLLSVGAVAAVALVAAMGPTWRACEVEPHVALRKE